MWLIYDGHLGRIDALLLLIAFIGVMKRILKASITIRRDTLEKQMERELSEITIILKEAVLWTISGLLLLLLSSKLLIWGATKIAQNLGTSDMVIGLTIVAIGTSLPELVSTVLAAKKGEDDLALGNIIGSNLFNTTAVVGLAGAICPMDIPRETIVRDWPLMTLLTFSLFALSSNRQSESRISRAEGSFLFTVFVGYTAYLFY